MANINDSFLRDLSHDGDFINNENGDIKQVQGRNNLRQAILHRLITSQGTIVHRPDYGVGIKEYQGAISTLSKQRELALKIQEQLLEDTRIESIDSVKFTENTDYRTGTFIVEMTITAAGIGQIDETIEPFGDF